MKLFVRTIVLCLLPLSLWAAVPTETELKYRTHFGDCPTRSAGSMSLKLIKTFEERKSLRAVKNEIINEKLDQKHFITDYKISYDPMNKQLDLRFDCPKPLMKVQIYKENGLEGYEAILVENGKLFDPTYEVLLRTEKKLSHELPYLALPVGEMDQNTQEKITSLMLDVDGAVRKKISEVILDDKGELTVILSISGRPSSVFLGAESWTDKMHKLEKIVGYMEAKKRIPSIINLTNSKKVVVKFSDAL